MAQNFAADQTAVRKFATHEIAEGRPHLAKAIQTRFAVSRPTAHNYIKTLLDEGFIVRAGVGRYELAHKTYQFMHRVEGLQEHEIWANEIAPTLEGSQLM